MPDGKLRSRRWHFVGAGLEGGLLRIYLTGRVRVEVGETLLDEACLPGRQGRTALAMLVAERDRPVARDELAEELWPGQPPAAWEPALRAIMSKLRDALAPAGLGRDAVSSSFGCYRIHLPGDAWIDLDAAAAAVHEAEAALSTGDVRAAYGPTFVGFHITRRPFLPGAGGPWCEDRRAALQALRLRALGCVLSWNVEMGDGAAASAAGETILGLDPFSEPTYRALMRVHAQAGGRARALRVYERCRRLLAEEMGVPPSAETEKLYLELLRS